MAAVAALIRYRALRRPACRRLCTRFARHEHVPRRSLAICGAVRRCEDMVVHRRNL